MLTLLTLLALLALLPLLAMLIQLLLHLLLQLLGLALQHLLLPLLLSGLGIARALLLSQTLLALGQLVQLFQRVVNFLRLLFGAGRRGLLGLVLIFLGIEFEIEERRQIPRRAAAAAASTPAARSKRDLNVPVGGFRALEELQSLLLIGNGVLPLLLLQLLRGRRHRIGRRDHILLEFADGLHLIGQLAGLQTAGKSDGLIAQSGLRLGQQLGHLGGLLLGRVLVALLLEGAGDDLLLALRDLRGLIAPASAASATTPALLRLREVPLIRVGLDEHHIGMGFGVGVLGGGVDAHQIAGNQLEILKRKRGRAVGLSCALLLEQVHRFLWRAVDRIMQRDAVEAVIAVGFDAHGYFFDGEGVVIAARAHQRDLRRVGFAGLDEKILADADGLAVLDAGDVIDAVLIHLDGSAIDVIFTACFGIDQLDRLSVVEQDLAARKRAVGGNLEHGLSAGDGAQIAAALLNLGGKAGPGGETVRHANLFHRGQIGDVNVIVLRRHGSGGDIVFDVLGQTGKQILIAAGEIAGRFALHRNLLPLGGSLKAGIQLYVGRLQTGGNRRNHLVGVAAHDGVAGSHAQLIQRGLVVMRPGPQQRGAITQKTGTGGDHPDQDGEGADAWRPARPTGGRR